MSEETFFSRGVPFSIQWVLIISSTPKEDAWFSLQFSGRQECTKKYYGKASPSPHLLLECGILEYPHLSPTPRPSATWITVSQSHPPSLRDTRVKALVVKAANKLFQSNM